MDVLVFTRNSRIAEHADLFRDEFSGEGEFVRFRNADAHAAGDREPADIVLVDDDFPHVADDYRRTDATVELFDAGELGAPEPPDPEGDAVALDADAFASPTAHDVAVEAGLGPDAFDGVEPAGKTGYTTAQVRETVG